MNDVRSFTGLVTYQTLYSYLLCGDVASTADSTNMSTGQIAHKLIRTQEVSYAYKQFHKDLRLQNFNAWWGCSLLQVEGNR